MTASPLELLHPSGRVQRVLLRGEGCPAALIPTAATPVSADADLAIVAPSPAELGQHHWLERAAADVAAALAEHGFAYAILPRRLRARARDELRRAGLAVEAPSVILPSAEQPRYVLPLRAETWRYVVGRLIAAGPPLRRVLLAVRELPYGSAVLERALPTVGIVGRPPGADALAAWTARLGGEARETAHAVVATSWRGPAGAAVVYCFAPGEVHPWGLAKVAAENSPEAALLERLGGEARAAGARVPRVLASGRLHAASVVVETTVAGRPAADLLRRSPERFAEVASKVTAWLERWNRATATPIVVTPDRLEEELVAPATALAPLLAGGNAYRDWLAVRCAAFAGSRLPVVAAHHDLTTWNVLLDERGDVGVLDWAEAEQSALPLTDFFYAVADAALASDARASRRAAVQSCFSTGGARVGSVAPMRERLATALALTPEALELCFHACWLRHAVNEQRERPAGDRSFLEIVRWLAR